MPLGEGNEWKAQVVCFKISILEAYVVISVYSLTSDSLWNGSALMASSNLTLEPNSDSFSHCNY